MKGSNVVFALMLAAMIVVPAVAIADADFSMADDTPDADGEKKQATSPWFVGLFGILFVIAIAAPAYIRYKEKT